jgi:predicted nucleic acid-binding protein
MAKRDISKPTYYLDSCVLIDLIERPETEEPAKTVAAIISAAEEGKLNLVTSTLTIVEVTYVKREIDGKALDASIEEQIEQLWHPASSPIRLVDVHEIIAREAVRLLRDNLKRGWTKTRSADAIHLVTARREFASEFLTNEHAMKKWGEILGFKVCAPHFESPEPSGGLFKETQPPPPGSRLLNLD